MIMYECLMRLCEQINCSFDFAYFLSIFAVWLHIHLWTILIRWIRVLLAKVFNTFHKKDDEEDKRRTIN